MERVPADIGDWGVGRVFLESGRLLSKYFCVFLPVVLRYIFPASLTKALYYQFLYALDHSPDAESRSMLATCISSAIFILPKALLYEGGKMIYHKVKNVIYDVSGSELGDGVNAQAFGVFFSRRSSMGKKLKTLTVGLLLMTVWAAISTSGTHFTPERVAEMGLPAWTIFVFTFLVTLLSSAASMYLILVISMLFMWTCSPELHAHLS